MTENDETIVLGYEMGSYEMLARYAAPFTLSHFHTVSLNRDAELIRF